MIPQLSMISALVEEFAITRKALTVLRTAGTVKNLSDVIKKITKDETSYSVSAPFDELYMFILGHGIFSLAYANHSDRKPTFLQIDTLIENSLVNSSYRNTLPDADQKIAAFLGVLGRLTAPRFPEAIDYLTILALEQAEKDKLSSLSNAFFSDKSAVNHVKLKMAELSMPNELVVAVFDLFQQGWTKTITNNIEGKLYATYRSYQSSAIGLVLAAARSLPTMGAPIPTHQNVRQAIFLRTAYLPSGTPVSGHQDIKRYQTLSLLPNDIKEMEKKIMASRGYTYDVGDSAWKRPLDVLINQVVNSKADDAGFDMTTISNLGDAIIKKDLISTVTTALKVSGTGKRNK